MSITRIIAIAASAALLQLLPSCGKLAPGPGAAPGPVPVGFSTEGTRAAGEIAGGDVDGMTFGVFAYDTGHYRYGDSNMNPNFMYNEKVTYDGAAGRWSYYPVKYWPNGEGEVDGNSGERKDYLSFFAYAPHSDNDPADPAGYCITTFSEQVEQGNPWLIYRIHENVADQVDLLFATGLVDRVKPDVDECLRLSFRHALACVGEKVSVGCSASLAYALETEAAASGERIQVVLQDVRVTYRLTERAKLVLYNTGGPARWQPVLNGESTTERTVTYGESLGHVVYSTDPAESEGTWESPDGKGVFYIPLDVMGDYQTATISVVYAVRRIGLSAADTVREKTATIRLSQYPEAFAPGKKLSDLSLYLF